MARAVFPDLVHRVPVEGEVLVMTPTRDCLLVASARDPEALQRVAELAIEQHDTKPYRLSMQPLVLRDETWEPLEIGSAAGVEIRRRMLGGHAEHYALQAKAHEDGEDIFFASLLQDVRDGCDEFATVTTWPHDVPTLMPKADTVGVWRSKTELIRASWDDVARDVGGLKLEPGMWPPRYRAMRSPTDQQFAALEAVGQAVLIDPDGVST